ncbi:3-oxoacyl-[acyl-carrier protein] reductase/sorbitol-6-phosphate 2-dehydrogenase [Devosia sp. YR412]|uniref:SDR family NAD(P)-dependent oxidoreductase n=1 Tax=Devosia sp. YR412 TaxID=1881030 RepID=UPI0008AB851A|nr:SDR family oxidoreductase [Devosia sp. YR412]SEQ40229.1 3-oxoacyl-[acyl-carrier protein] reductase/sorbitol-6-phosphate 2-dehydrogenase [Devosia sp. YR412]
MNLGEQRIVVTGAAQGLGAAIARRYAASGAKLVLMDYNAEGLQQVVAACDGRAEGIAVDLSDATATQQAIDRALAITGPVTTLVHNAAILIEKPFVDEDFASFFKTVNVGLQAGYQLAHAVWPGMVANGGGAMIFVSSRSGIQGFANETAYCAAKHALEGFSQSLAAEGAAVGIQSNTITPGMYMQTPMSERNYSAELKTKWVDPMMLTSAFVALAERRHPDLNGQRLNAWDMSQAIDTAA